MIKKSLYTMTVCSLLLAGTASAADLIQVYQQSLTSDPTFQIECAQMLVDKQALPISIAALLPSAAFAGSIQRQHIDNETANPFAASTDIFYNTSRQYSISASQPVFNVANWMRVKNAQASVKAAEATFNAAAQDLMVRAATAYFNVLEAYDDLRFTIDEKKAFERQLLQTRERFKVGIVAITDVYEAKSSYDSSAAQVIAAKNTLATRIEQLREISGRLYPTLIGIRYKLPLIIPQPANIDDWTRTARRQSYDLLAARYTTIAAKENVYVQRAGHLPTADATADYSFDRETNQFGNGPSKRKVAAIGFSVNFPIFQGGGIVALTHQAIYQYRQAVAQQEFSLRTVISNTRTSYLGIISGINIIRADRQTIISSDSALKATEAGYMVGTRTIVDVLDAQSDLSEAQRNYARDQYSYILSILRLKQAAGTLHVEDLQEINSWLSKRVSLATYQEVIHSKGLYEDKYKLPKLEHVEGLMPPTTTTPPKEKSAITPAEDKPVTPKSRAVTPAEDKPIIPESKAFEKVSLSPRDLTKFNAKHYTLQLLSGTHQHTVAAYIKKHRLQGKASYITVKKHGRRYYDVLYGDFASWSNAKHAMQSLPKAVLVNKPWIRRFESVRRHAV